MRSELMLVIAQTAYYEIFWSTPYRTGNLARNGISDFGNVDDGYGWTMFQKGAEYGAILNEAQIIHYNIRNPRTGKVYSGQYPNRHYQWVDKFAEQFATKIPLLHPNVRRVL